MSTIGRAPKDYNAGAWGRIVGRIDKAINTLARRLGTGEDATRQLQITQREQRAALNSMLTPEATFEWSEYVDPSTNVVYAQCIVEVTRGWAIISDFEYRSAYGNIGSTDSWLSYKTNPAMQFVVNTNYKGGGYYLYREQIDFIKSGQTFCVELRGKAANDDVWLASSHTFDGNTKPEFLSEPKLVLQWYSSTETWQVRAIGEADDDTASIGFVVSDNVELDQQATTQYGDFVTGVTNLSGSDKRFNVLLGSFTPSTKTSQRTLWVLAGAFDAASAATLDGTDNFVRVLSSIEIPVSPTAAGILDAGDINGELLADTAKRASVNLTAQHTSGQESSSVTVSGTIQYDGDATTYTISSQNISVGTSGALYYIYFDPSISTSQLQSSTTKTTATQISGKRIFVGIASGDSVERAFFVFTSDAPVISAPYVYASKLEALTATMGTLEAGTAKIGDNVNGAENGIHINQHNYWYEDGDFSVGNGSNAITYDSVTGTLTVGVATGIETYKQSAPAPSPVNAGDLWYNETDDNIQRYNGTGWDIIGSDVEYWRSVSDTTKITGSVVRTGVIQSNNWPSSGTQIDLDNDTIKSGGSASPAFSVTSAGVMSCAGASVSGAITANSGSITGTLTMGLSGKIEFTGGGYLAPRYLTSGTNTFHLTGQGIRVGETSAGEIFVDAQGGRVDIYSREGEPIALSASGGVSGADITLTATDDISISASGSLSLQGKQFPSYSTGYLYYNGTNLSWSGTWDATNISLAKGGTGASLSDPNADRILFWDDSSNAVTWLAAGDGIAFNGTNLQMDWSAATASVAPYEAIIKDADQNIKTLVISGFGASLIDDSNAATARTTLGLGSGLTTTVKETQIQSIGGGDSDQWRERDLTFTNGILTATGAWSAWQDIVTVT